MKATRPMTAIHIWDEHPHTPYPTPAETARALSDARRASTVQVADARDEIVDTNRRYEEDGQRIALFDSVALLMQRGPVTMADLLALRLPGYSDPVRLLCWIQDNVAVRGWGGFMTLTPAWSQEDWRRERRYLAGLHPCSDEDAHMHDMASDHASELLSLAHAHWHDGVSRAMTMLQAEALAFSTTVPERPALVDDRAAGVNWPSTKHLRLHYLADLQGGWICRDCGVGLVDVCREEDVLTDDLGRRYVDPASGKQLPTIDHGIPQALAGSDLPVNLALTCRPCNSRKGAA